METVMSQPDWEKFSNQRGADAKYQQAGRKDLGQAGPKKHGFDVSERDPSGWGENLREVPTGAPKAPAGNIQHPTSPREDETFAAIHDRQDELKRKDPKASGTGDTDPQANARPPSGS
jgi:hypothetical protein